LLAVSTFAGLACGVLLVAIGLSLWGGSRQTPDLSRATRAIGWLAGAFLLVGALLAWQGDPGFSGVASRSLLMAALAVPVGNRRYHSSPWGSVMRALPALVLAGTALFWSPRPIGGASSDFPAALAEFVIVVCAGLGARALSEALSEIVVSIPRVEWPSTATCVLLTSLVGLMGLVNLWQRGTVWGVTPGESILVGAWLAWSAAWLGGRWHPRRRAGLVIVAASLLVAAALAQV